MEMNIPIWTASQAHRDSANSDIVGLENMSEAYGKAMVADAVLSLSRKASEKATGSARLFIAKNRAGKDGVIFPVHIDTARSKITILDENELSLNEAGIIFAGSVISVIIFLGLMMNSQMSLSESILYLSFSCLKLLF